MAQDKERLKSVRERTARLRERIENAGWRDASARPVLDILKGVLDLLDDTLANEGNTFPETVFRRR